MKLKKVISCLVIGLSLSACVIVEDGQSRYLCENTTANPHADFGCVLLGAVLVGSLIAIGTSHHHNQTVPEEEGGGD
jgi:hypothetical protein